MQKMKAQTAAVFNSNDIYPISADSTIPFEQHRDMFYLSGVDQEKSILVLFPDAIDPKHREVLFLIETNEHIAVWEGEKLTKEKAYETTGIKTVYWLNQFDAVFKAIMTEAEGVYLNTNEHQVQIQRWKQEKLDLSNSLNKNIQLIKSTKVLRFYTLFEV